ncbi:MAG: contractile injection system protein, VgrG/Pvc8 family [Reinekea sp.]
MSTTQTRQTRITLQLANGHSLAVTGLDGWEDISNPTRLVITCPDHIALDADDLPGQPASVVINAAEYERYWRLAIDAVQYRSNAKGEYWEISLCSKLHWGKKLQRTRLFMGLDRLQVLQQLLREMGYQAIEWNMILDLAKTPEGPYLQAQEDNLTCFQRLLAEVGGFYWFEHHPNKQYETLIIRNNSAQGPYLAGIEWVQSVSGMSPDFQLNRITRVRRKITGQRSRFAHALNTIGSGLSQHNSNVHCQEPPLKPAHAALRAHYQQQAAEQFNWQLELHSHQPMLTAGYSMALRASQLGMPESGEFRLHKVRHHASTAGSDHGLRYRNEAWAIRRITPIRIALPKKAHTPLLFPAKIESNLNYAALSPDGRYYLRPEFDQSDTDVTGASPLLERLSLYSSPATAKHPSAGWHFPLLDKSTVLVSCLNNDPNRMAILGFIPNQHQLGPVTNANASQSRIVTPGQNELVLDDQAKARRIALFTFDGQNQCELCAQNEAEFASILSKFGNLRLAAGGRLLINTIKHLEERNGANRQIRVKQNSTLTSTENAIQHQAATSLTLRAQNNIRHSAQGDYSVKAPQGDITITASNGLNTTVSGGDMHVKVSGRASHQTTGPINLSADGGTITITDGIGGIKIGAGTIKLWGKKISLKGKQGVTYNGEINYDRNGANEPESIPELADIEIPEIAALELPGFISDQDLWLEIELRNEDQKAIANTDCLITAPDGTEYPCRTDAEGVARIDGISHLSDYLVTFPKMPTPARISVEKTTQAPESKFINLVLTQPDGQPIANARAVLTLGEETQELTSDESGRIRQVLTNTTMNEAHLDVYSDADSDTPAHRLRIQLGALDKINSVNGIQSRCNHLGFDCGPVDGHLGEKTQTALTAFQAKNGLAETGEPDEATLSQLLQIHGG